MVFGRNTSIVFGRKKKAVAEALERERLESTQLRLQQEQQHRRETEFLENQRLIEAEEHRRQVEVWEAQKRQDAEDIAKRRRERELKLANEQMKHDREQARLAKQRQISPQALRELRDLIRTRYQLDVEIWGLRTARGPDRPIVLTKMEKADDILRDIQTRVGCWEENARLWKGDEWKVAQQIKERIFLDGKRLWDGDGPWDKP
ncbi:hypothetical protein VTL71DRAFT_10891 [Oculimacula yallundae]|uniref:Uncharacterized protein n=1 Tax=Oculimacula yallundae TaxID=86028 RepID=A0ABR4CUE5_9HELO